MISKRGSRRRWPGVAALCFLGSAVVAGGCADSTPDHGCAAGQVPTEGECRRLCNTDAQCDAKTFCSDGVCVDTVCGNGAVEGDEVCDLGSANSDNGFCTRGCVENVCGDGLRLLGAEACDDGNLIDNDGCSSTCVIDGMCSATTEVCDGIDNDCDNEADESADLTAPSADLQDGVCAGSFKVCAGVPGWVEPSYGPSFEVTEVSCDGLDNDCDGVTDPGCMCVSGTNRPCGTSQGLCMEGQQSCIGGVWDSACNGGIGPEPEMCDNLDNNCNNDTDEGLSRMCMVTNMHGSCSGFETCLSGGWIGCTAATPAPEVCDGMNNDCDLETDEGCPDFQDDFTTGANWVASHADFAVTGGELTFSVFMRLGNASRITHDLNNSLGSSASDQWVLRFRIQWSSLNSQSVILGGLSSTDDASNQVQDFVGMLYRFDSGGGTDYSYRALHEKSNTVSLVSGTQISTIQVSTGTPYWVEVKRVAAGSMSVEMFTDAFTTSLGLVTDSIDSTIDNLRFIKFMNDVTSTPGDGDSQAGVIDDVQFWDGVTSVP